VVVVGAGFAGLVTARELKKQGVSAIVAEARDRVGGRVHTIRLEDGTAIDVGGQWTGPGQDRIRALADEMGVRSFPTWPEGSHVSYRANARAVFRGLAPEADIETVKSFFEALQALDAMSQEVPADEPWTAPHAVEWDALTAEAWMARNLPNAAAQDLMRMAIEAVYAVEPHDVSLLFMLWYARTGRGLLYLISTEGGAQADRYEGGMQLVAERVAQELGDAVRLSQPVRRITQDAGGVAVEGDRFMYSGQRAVVALPPALAGRIDYRPPMPPLRDQLTQRTPMGSVIKCQAVYDKPFWRDEGLSGRVISDCGPVKVAFDNSPPSGAPGVLMGFLEGGDGRRMSNWPEEERRKAVLECFVRYFGPQARSPRRYIEGNWPADEWSRGCYGGVFPAGTLASCGPALREPVGRIHWAGTETSTVFPGYIDGAVRSGERAAAEVLAALAGEETAASGRRMIAGRAPARRAAR
jgi:monoamine oxidase